MRKTRNVVTIKGRIHDKSSLALKKVQNQESARYGQDFIGGSLDIATDDAGMNVVTVYFTFVQPTYSSGKVNSTYGVLKNIIESGKTILSDGAEEATIVKIDGSIELNDFYTDRGGQETLVSAKRINGSFVNLIKASELGDEKKRNTFEADMFINGVNFVEADEERKIPEDYLTIKGAVFNFRNELLPIEFNVHSQGGIKYFESLDITPSTPVFTKVWGNVISSTVVEKIEEESAFGEPSVREVTKSHKEYVVTGASSSDKHYEIGDEKNGITNEDLAKCKQDREVKLAEIKRKSDEYKARKAAGGTAPSASNGVQTAPVNTGDFLF